MMSIWFLKKYIQNDIISVSFYGGDILAGNYYQPFSLRISEELLDKVKYIATKNKRSANKEIEFLIEAAIEQFEKDNGKIEL